MNTARDISRVRLTVACGELAVPLAGRLVMSIGAETDLGVDRVSEAAMLAETITGLCSEMGAESCVELTVRSAPRLLELRVGQLGVGGARRLLEAGAAGGLNHAIDALASSTVVRQGRDGSDVLVVTVGDLP